MISNNPTVSIKRLCANADVHIYGIPNGVTELDVSQFLEKDGRNTEVMASDVTLVVHTVESCTEVMALDVTSVVPIHSEELARK